MLRSAGRSVRGVCVKPGAINSPRPPAPEAGIIPLDHVPGMRVLRDPPDSDGGQCLPGCGWRGAPGVGWGWRGERRWRRKIVGVVAVDRVCACTTSGLRRTTKVPSDELVLWPRLQQGHGVGLAFWEWKNCRGSDVTGLQPPAWGVSGRWREIQAGVGRRQACK